MFFCLSSVLSQIKFQLVYRKFQRVHALRDMRERERVAEAGCHNSSLKFVLEKLFQPPSVAKILTSKACDVALCVSSLDVEDTHFAMSSLDAEVRSSDVK